MKYSEIGKYGTKRIKKEKKKTFLKKCIITLIMVLCFYSGILYAIYHDTIVNYIKESSVLLYLQ